MLSLLGVSGGHFHSATFSVKLYGLGKLVFTSTFGQAFLLTALKAKFTLYKVARLSSSDAAMRKHSLLPVMMRG